MIYIMIMADDGSMVIFAIFDDIDVIKRNESNGITKNDLWYVHKDDVEKSMFKNET